MPASEESEGQDYIQAASSTREAFKGQSLKQCLLDVFLGCHELGHREQERASNCDGSGVARMQMCSASCGIRSRAVLHCPCLPEVGGSMAAVTVVTTIVLPSMSVTDEPSVEICSMVNNV